MRSAECGVRSVKSEIRSLTFADVRWQSGLSLITEPDCRALCIGCSIRFNLPFMTIFPPKTIWIAALLFACFVTAAFADQKENFQIRVSALGPNSQRLCFQPIWLLRKECIAGDQLERRTSGDQELRACRLGFGRSQGRQFLSLDDREPPWFSS